MDPFTSASAIYRYAKRHPHNSGQQGAFQLMPTNRADWLWIAILFAVCIGYIIAGAFR